MGSAMTTPAKVGQIQMRTPETRQLRGVRDVQGEARLGLQKAQTAIAIGQSVTKIAEVGLMVREASQIQASNAGVSDYVAGVTAYQTQLKIDGNKVDEATGRPIFESADKKLAEYSETLKQDILDKYQIKGGKALNNWNIKTQGTDTRMNKDIALYQNKAITEQALARADHALINTRDPDTAGKVFNDLVSTGAMSQQDADFNMEKWLVNENYRGMIESIERNDNLDQLTNQREMLKTGAHRFSEQQVSALNDQIDRSIYNHHSRKVSDAYKAGGLYGMNSEIERLNDAGYAESGTRDEMEHNDLITSLRTDYRREKGLDAEKQVAMTNQPYLDAFYGSDGTGAGVASYIMSSKKARDAVDADVEHLAFIDNFYENEDVGNVMNRARQVGYLPTPFVSRVVNDLDTGTPMQQQRALEWINQIDLFSNGLLKLEGSTRDKVNYLKSAKFTGSDFTQAVAEYGAWSTRGPVEKTADRQSAEEALSKLGSVTTALQNIEGKLFDGKDMIRNSIPKFIGGGGGAIDFHPSTVKMLENSFIHAYTMSKDPDAAMKRVYEGFARNYSIGSTSGEPRYEQNPPEKMIPTPKHMTDEEKNESIIAQMDTQVAEMNERRAAYNLPPIDKEALKLEYNSNTNEWAPTLYASALPKYGGDVNEIEVFKFGAQPTLETSELMRKTNDAFFTTNRAQIDRMLADNNEEVKNVDSYGQIKSGGGGWEEAVVIGSEGYVPVYGQHDFEFRGVVNERAYIEAKWKGLSDGEKSAANADWEKKAESLRRVMQKQGIPLNPDAESRIAIYLFGKGYMKADENKNLQLPPRAMPGYIPEME